MPELYYTKPREQDEDHDSHICVEQSTQSIMFNAQEIESIFNFRKLNCAPLNKELAAIDNALGLLLDALEEELAN